MLKLLLPVALQLLNQNKKPTDSLTAEHIIEQVKRAAREEALSLIGKIFAGLALTGLLIFTLIAFFKNLNAYILATYNSGPIIIIIFMGLSSAILIGALFMIFQKPKKINLAKQLPAPTVQAENFSIPSLNQVLNHFLSGLVEGLHKENSAPVAQNNSNVHNSNLKTDNPQN